MLCFFGFFFVFFLYVQEIDQSFYIMKKFNNLFFGFFVPYILSLHFFRNTCCQEIEQSLYIYIYIIQIVKKFNLFWFFCPLHIVFVFFFVTGCQEIEQSFLAFFSLKNV